MKESDLISDTPVVDEDAVVDFLIPDMEKEVEKLQQELEAMAQGVVETPFHVLLKEYFDLPPHTSLRQAEAATGIRRSRIKKILDGKVDATPEEIEMLTTFVETERRIADRKRLTDMFGEG